MVQEHHVNIVNIQLFQCLVNSFGGLAVLVRIQLSLHKDFFPRHTGFTDAFANFPLISVEGCSVNQAVSAFYCANYRIYAGISMQGIGAKT